MSDAAKKSLPLIGIIFLLLAVFKFVNGGNWVVWAILGCLFGGLRIFAHVKSGGADHESR